MTGGQRDLGDPLSNLRKFITDHAYGEDRQTVLRWLAALSQGAAHEERGLDVERLRYDINTELAGLTESASQFEQGAAAAYHFVLSRLGAAHEARGLDVAGSDSISYWQARALAAEAHEERGLDVRDLEQRFWNAESKWAAKGSGMTKEQQTGASMAFMWLRTAATPEAAHEERGLDVHVELLRAEWKGRLDGYDAAVGTLDPHRLLSAHLRVGISPSWDIEWARLVATEYARLTTPEAAPEEGTT